MTTQTSGMELINQYSFKLLNASSDGFRNGNGSQGFDHFKMTYPAHQYKVYEQIWIDRGKPQGNPEYGRQTFNDTNGLSSTMEEKALAIDKYLISIKEKKESNDEIDIRLSANDGSPRREWRYNTTTQKWEWKDKPTDWHKWGEKMDKLIPKGDDPEYAAKVTGIAIGIIGTAIVIFLARSR